jgi:transposase
VDDEKLTIRLAYFPPYHSKYNPIERVWGVLEQHWNGSLLDSFDTVLGFARTLTWKQRTPVVHVVEQVYHTGVKLTQKAMNRLEKRFERLEGLEKWFVTIRPLLPDTGSSFL